MKQMKVIALCALSSLMLLTACGSRPNEEPQKTPSENTSQTQKETESQIGENSGTNVQIEKESQAQANPQTNVQVEKESQTTIETQSETTYIPGSNQDDAVLIPLGTKVFGTVEKKGNVWFAFTTSNETNATYTVTFVNETAEGNTIEAIIFDEYGTKLTSQYASSNGIPTTLYGTDITPNTTYYIRIHVPNTIGNMTSDYSLIVKNQNAENTAYKTTDTFSDARGSANATNDNLVAGTNLNDALLIPLETKVSGTIEKKANSWFAFTTSDSPNATYNLTLVNKTPEGNSIQGLVYDEYGTNLADLYAYSNGTSSTIGMEKLLPNTTYYIRIHVPSVIGNITSDYSLVVKSSEQKVEEKAPLVFEVPFEINETQVQFVINKATFIDEQKAKEVLKPVAEAILKAPDHAVLIAGTTATDGTQASCVDLANRRAEAVKNLLIETYGVSESQLKTIGLGYELDPFERGQDRDVNGKFVESEAKKNRRVVILDIDDPIAQELLKLNP